MYWNTYTSIESMAVFTNVNLFVKEFGIDKIKAADNARVAIIVDMVLLGWGLVMGPTWRYARLWSSNQLHAYAN